MSLLHELVKPPGSHISMRLPFLTVPRQFPNSVFYAETTFAGGEAQESSNWLSALVNRSLVDVLLQGLDAERFSDFLLLE